MALNNEKIKKQGMIKTAGTTFTPTIAIAMILANNAVINRDKNTIVTLDMKYPNGLFLRSKSPEINAIG